MKDDQRCTTLTRALGEDPGGTASPWHRIVLVELPLPWPDHIERHPLLTGAPVGRPGTRIQALADSTHPGDSPTEQLRVATSARAPQGPFAGFALTTGTHAPDGVAAAVGATLSGSGAVPTEPASSTPPIDDVLVCTHGTRDRCCGKFGMELFDAVCGRIDVGRWRTSHTGGHRFAPTAMTLPDGCLWAHLDPDLLVGIVERTADPERAARHLRGCAGIDDGPAQLADRSGLAAHGWDWLGAQRQATTVVRSDVATVELGWSSPVLGTGTLRARFVAGEPIPVPPCGAPLDQAAKSTPSWVTQGLDWG